MIISCNVTKSFICISSCEQPDHVKDDPLVMREGTPEKICRSSLTLCIATISNIIQVYMCIPCHSFFHSQNIIAISTMKGFLGDHCELDGGIDGYDEWLWWYLSWWSVTEVTSKLLSLNYKKCFYLPSRF